MFAATYLLLIPGRGLVNVLPNRPESLLLVGVFLACVALGGAFSALTGIRVAHVVAGGFAVYALWFLHLEVTAGPFDSPVHVLVGVVYLLGFGLGAGLVGRADRTRIAPRLSAFE